MSLARLEALARALQQLPAALEAATADVVRDNAHVLEDATTAQLAQGLDGDGQPIRPAYTPLTVKIKQQKGQPTDRVTLRDEGDFYAGIVAQVRGQAVELVGTDRKTPGLTEKYGADILGLAEPALEEFRQDYVLPELQQKAREALAL